MNHQWEWVHATMRICKEQGMVAPRITVGARLFNALAMGAAQNHFAFEQDQGVSRLRSHIYHTVIVCSQNPRQQGMVIESALGV